MLNTKIGIWGPPKCGKTSYLAYLLSAISSKNNIGLNIKAKNEKSRQFYITGYQDFTDYGRFPDQTGKDPVGTELSTIYSFLLTRKSETEQLLKRPKTYNLDMIDVAGELITDTDDSRGYFKELSNCQGILLMVDAGNNVLESSFNTSYARETHYLIEKIINSATESAEQINLACCLTKMDLDDRIDYFFRPEEYIKKYLPQTYNTLLDRLPDPENRLRFFSTSVVGRYTVGDHTRPNIVPAGNYEFRVRDTKLQKSSDLIEANLKPFLWLIDQLDQQQT